MPSLRPHDLSTGVPDADLIARWVTQRDEAAFELLVRRHAPTVLAACRRLLADSNDADDAFQATFLVLARKAASVARGEVLAAWLHRVACRAALRVRANRAKHAEHQESDAVEQLPARAPADPAWAELFRVLDEEVEKLPERHRIVFVLCCLEGKTGEEAGKLLGCPPGTISSRLTRARERLRDRLTRRGFTPAALVLAALTGDAGAITVPNTLVESIMRTATPFATASPHGGSPTRSATIAEGVVRTMLVNKLKLIPALLMIGLMAAGAVLAASDPNRDENPNSPQPVAKLAADEKAPPAAPVVRLVKPQPGGLDRVFDQRCVAQAGQEVRLFPAASGVLKRVDAHIGDRVKAGQLLAEIDAPALDLDKRLAVVGVEQAEALLKEAEARITTAKVEIEAAKGVIRLRQAEVAAAKTNAELRKQALDLRMKGGMALIELTEANEKFRVAEGQFDAATVGVENAKTDLAGKESKLIQAEAGVTSARANVKAAIVALDRSRLAIAQTQITAPFDGILAESHAAVGQFARIPGERADPTPLFTVMRVDALRLTMWVPERDVARIEPGLAAEVTFDAIPNVKVAGKVARVGFVVEPNDKTVRVEIDIPNPKNEARPGMTGTVTLNLKKGAADVLRVPLSSLVQGPPGKPGGPNAAVYVYKDGKAKLTPVRLGHRDGKEAEVLSGLGRDDLVVADPKELVGMVEVAVEGREAPLPK